MNSQPRTSRLSILAMLLSLFPIFACVLLGLAAFAFPDFFAPPPGHSSVLLGPSAGVFWLVGIASWIFILAAFVLGIISLVRISRHQGELKGTVFAWVGVTISSL